MSVKKIIKIPFHLCDPAGIIFFGSLYEIYHQFLETNIHELGVSWEKWFKGEAAAPIRALQTQYNAPLFFGKSYDAILEVDRISTTTVTFKFTVLSQEKICAQTEVTHCFIDKKTVQKTPVPSEIKSALQEVALNP